MMQSIARNPADVGDLVVWPGSVIDGKERWFVAVAHAIDDAGYVSLVNSRGRIRDIDDMCKGRVWELIPLQILTSPKAINEALATTFASRAAVAEHLKPHLTPDYKITTDALYAARRALILRGRIPQDLGDSPSLASQDHPQEKNGK